MIPALATCLLAGAAWAHVTDLAVGLSSTARLGRTEWIQGEPILVEVALVNLVIQRETDLALRTWRTECRAAERDGRPSPTKPDLESIARSGERTIAGSAVEWISKLDLELRDSGGAVILDTAQLEPELVVLEEEDPQPVIAGREPAWTVLDLGPELAEKLQPGEYLLRAEWPGAEAAELVLQVLPADTPQFAAERDYTRAEYALAHGDPQTALNAAGAALGGPIPEHDMLYLLLGQAHDQLGDTEQAIEHYGLFLKTYENSPRWHYPEQIRARLDQLARGAKGENK